MSTGLSMELDGSNASKGMGGRIRFLPTPAVPRVLLARELTGEG